MASKITPGEKLMLDDLFIGQIFKSEDYALAASEIIEFASKYDPQPFHLSDDGAKDSIFGSLAASGWQTAAITMRLFVGSVPIEGGLIGAGADVSWTRPVRPGDILHVDSEVTQIRPSKSRPDRGTVTMRSITKNQKDETVQIMESRIVVPRKPQ